MIRFTIDHFIRRFESIPYRFWAVGAQRPSIWCGDVRGLIRIPAYVRLEHIGTLPTAEDYMLCRLEPQRGVLTMAEDVNDGMNIRFQQNHPKDRILAWLRSLKAKGAK